MSLSSTGWPAHPRNRAGAGPICRRTRASAAPTRRRPRAQRGRYVPRAVRRVVWERNGERGQRTLHLRGWDWAALPRNRRSRARPLAASCARRSENRGESPRPLSRSQRPRGRERLWPRFHGAETRGSRLAPPFGTPVAHVTVSQLRGARAATLRPRHQTSRPKCARSRRLRAATFSVAARGARAEHRARQLVRRSRRAVEVQSSAREPKQRRALR
jgi:hypothetical protein